MKSDISFLILFLIMGCASKPLTYNETIANSIEYRKSDFIKCYESRPEPRKLGTIRVSFFIEAAGEVKTASVLKDSTMRDAELETCILSVLKSISFYPPPLKDKGKVEVTYPFKFSSG